MFVCKAIFTLVFVYMAVLDLPFTVVKYIISFSLLFVCLCLVFSLPGVIGQFIERNLHGIFTFILALNVFENIFKTSLENAQN